MKKEVKVILCAVYSKLKICKAYNGISSKFQNIYVSISQLQKHYKLKKYLQKHYNLSDVLDMIKIIVSTTSQFLLLILFLEFKTIFVSLHNFFKREIVCALLRNAL